MDMTSLTSYFVVAIFYFALEAVVHVRCTLEQATTLAEAVRKCLF